MAETLERLRGEYRIEVQELNLLEHPEVAAEYGITSTPALIVNGELAAVGRIEERTLRETLAGAARGSG